MQPSTRRGRSRGTLALGALLLVAVAAFGLTYSSDRQAISSRDSRISSLEAAYARANGTISADASEIAALEGNLTTLGRLVAYFDSPDAEGAFNYTVTGCGSAPCAYAVSGAYANFGAAPAGGRWVVFSFYNDTLIPSGVTLEQLLCTTSVLLQSMGGRSVGLLPPTSCVSASGAPANRFAWRFTP